MMRELRKHWWFWAFPILAPFLLYFGLTQENPWRKAYDLGLFSVGTVIYTAAIILARKYPHLTQED